jgi:hypothetical protein
LIGYAVLFLVVVNHLGNRLLVKVFEIAD